MLWPVSSKGIKVRVSADPISQAWAAMMRVVFPFAWGKWFVFGFAVFLAHLGTELARPVTKLGKFVPAEWFAGLFPMPGAQETVADFLVRERGHYVALAAIAFVVGMVGFAVMSFVSSRGRFVFMDALIHGRVRLGPAWREQAARANAVWRFLLVTTAAFWLANYAAAAVGLWVVWPDIELGVPGERSKWVVLLGVSFLTILWLLYLKGLVVTTDFIVPMMLAQDIGPWRAWWVWLSDFLTHHMWAIVGFYLLRSVFLSTINSLGLLVCCLTCTIATLPYLHAVFLLPALVFDRCYSAYFVEQFGPTWRVFPRQGDAPQG